MERRFPIGAELTSLGTHFRVWAPGHEQVWIVEREPETRAAGRSHPLERDSKGYHAGYVASLGTGSLYSFRLGSDENLYPDPASRFQPEGVHGPSQVVDGRAFAWTDQKFQAVFPGGHVIYELHVGTFTKAGTFLAARAELEALARLGVTTLELLPIADFSGQFGWGYDGVDLWAPSRLYGRPDDVRLLIDTAHALGLAVILDVVYNHFGPEGNYQKAFSPDYFSDRYENEWGEPINFDGRNSGPVREFFIQNARYWIEEFHFDGLRLDATQSIFDSSQNNVISEITDAARTAGRALNKEILIVAENEPQEAKLARPVASGGFGCDALWNDDFHHTARVALTGRHQAYYSEYRGTPQELISALKWGYLYQGQHYFWQKQRRGQAALDLGAQGFVTYLQNHDQIANSLSGRRIHDLTSPGELRAMTALLLLAPSTPMLFQGQEFAASAPFLYFADSDPERARTVNSGRRQFLAQFPSIVGFSERLADASSRHTFERCKLDLSERETHHEAYALHRDLLALRREDPVFSQRRGDRMHGAILSDRALLLRFFSERGHRLMIVNLGADLDLVPGPEPLLAPPSGDVWRQIWSSENPLYGGEGYPAIGVDGIWKLPARSTHVFATAETATASETES